VFRLNLHQRLASFLDQRPQGPNPWPTIILFDIGPTFFKLLQAGVVRLATDSVINRQIEANKKIEKKKQKKKKI